MQKNMHLYIRRTLGCLQVIAIALLAYLLVWMLREDFFDGYVAAALALGIVNLVLLANPGAAYRRGPWHSIAYVWTGIAIALALYVVFSVLRQANYVVAVIGEMIREFPLHAGRFAVYLAMYGTLIVHVAAMLYLILPKEAQGGKRSRQTNIDGR